MTITWLQPLYDCTAYFQTAQAYPAVLGSLFLLGLAGGFLHCALMCGPFALMQLSAQLERTSTHSMSESKRLRAALLWPYHLGRATTYMALGALAAFAATSIAHIWLDIAPYLLLFASAVLFASLMPTSLQKNSVAARFYRSFSGPFTPFKNTITRITRPLFQAPFGLRGYALGTILGFIPCGMLYAALAAAAATANPWQGALSMGAFALGTVPALITVTWVGHLGARHIKTTFTPLKKVCTLGASAWLGAIAIGQLTH